MGKWLSVKRSILFAKSAKSIEIRCPQVERIYVTEVELLGATLTFPLGCRKTAMGVSGGGNLFTPGR